MAEYRLARRVGDVADRLDRLRSLNTRSHVWLLGTAICLLLLVAHFWLFWSVLSLPSLVGLVIVLLAIGWFVSSRRRHTLHDAAVTIEQRWPNLDSQLLTAIDQQPDPEVGGFNFLQHEVITETLLHSHRHDWQNVVPVLAMTRARLQHLTCVLLFLAAITSTIWVSQTKPQAAVSSTIPDVNGAESSDDAVTIDPGDVEIERGTSLVVMARFDRRVPDEVTLHATDAAGHTTTQALSKSLDDPLFGCRIARVNSHLSYHVTYDGHASEAYQISVFDFPRLEQADATIISPEYTGLGEKLIEDVRRVSIIEGSQLTLNFRLNKPIEYGILYADAENEFQLSPVDGSEDALDWTVTLTPTQKQTLTLELVDTNGRGNKEPPKFVIDVIPNKPPELAIAFPGKDVRISPLEEMAIEASAQDDFGLEEVGLIYQLPDSDEQSLKLQDRSTGDAKVSLGHQFTMENIHAQPNELVAYYLYADDIGPDGERRRTFSDLYFAEVRHFDEEYREVEAPQGQGEGGMPGAELLRLQRDIVNATWNLIRRESSDRPSPQLSEDAQTVADSELQAIELGTKLEATLKDPLSLQYISEALEYMSRAYEHLQTSASSVSAESLSEARIAAHNAYRALLKLQAREHQVAQSQSASQSQSQQSQQELDQQLKQLELKNNRNRYETEQQEQPSADREQLQVLNRLRELARRQGDLNEKIQELENALRAAESDEDRTEIERQLKRLQEEQQELLRDLDEVQERMSNEQNRSQMADAREQVQDVRENLRRTSEALKEGRLSRALAAGTRAERELQEMKEQLREQAAGQFADTMREMREDVRELAEQQQQLAGDLSGQSEPDTDSPPQLKDTKTDDLNEKLANQREELKALMEQMKDVIQESELSEPLLSKTLYDTVRKTRVDRPEESLAMTSQFLRYGLQREAAQAEAQAREGIETLKDGIEKAADSVLGNEVDALRRAKAELDELSKAIGDELAQADSQQADKQLTESNAERDSEGQSPDKSESAPRSDSANGNDSRPDSHPGVLSNFLPQGDTNGLGGASSPETQPQPLTGADFTPWSDRMRDVEEMIDDPDLRAQVAQIRDRAKQVRIDLKRHSKLPNWELVKTSIYGPMLELRNRLAEEIARREPSDEVVPIDRDPVPDRYTELVERYYERLGSGR